MYARTDSLSSPDASSPFKERPRPRRGTSFIDEPRTAVKPPEPRGLSSYLVLDLDLSLAGGYAGRPVQDQIHVLARLYRVRAEERSGRAHLLRYAIEPKWDNSGSGSLIAA